MDLEGKSTSQVQFNNPVPTAQQTGSTSQTGSAEQKNDSVREEKPKELSAAEKFEKFKAEGNEFVKKVIVQCLNGFGVFRIKVCCTKLFLMYGSVKKIT